MSDKPTQPRPEDLDPTANYIRKSKLLSDAMSHMVGDIRSAIEPYRRSNSALGEWWQHRPSPWPGRLRHLIFVVASIAGAMGVLSYIQPEVLVLLVENKLGLMAIVGSMLSVVFLSWTRDGSSSEATTFSDIDKIQSNDKELKKLLAAYRGSWKKTDDHDAENSDADMETAHDPASSLPNHQSEFARYADSVVTSLDTRIDLSEKKASMLLDQGTNYLRKGIYFFVVSIVVWQVAIAMVGFKAHMWVGIASCSLTFLVIEFLAAWFLKQYRSYVDSSLVYLRARSTFNKYLLSYYAITELCENDGKRSESLKLILDTLQEEIKWPELADVNKNDFNFMLQSVSSFSTVIENLKASLEPNKKVRSVDG